MQSPRAPRITAFTQLNVWNLALDLASDVYDITALFPRDERYGITAQLRRSSLSISLNIAEGYGRATRGEYLNQLSVAQGSANEVTTLCIFCERKGFASPEQLAPLRARLDRVSGMLWKLRSALRTGNRGPGTGDRGRGTGNGGPGTGTGNGGPGTGDRERGTGNRERGDVVTP